MRLLEEGLGGHGEELGGIGESVGAEHGGLAGRLALHALVPRGAEHALPARAGAAAAGQGGGAVGAAGGLVELVRELVQHHVAAVVRVGGAGRHVVP